MGPGDTARGVQGRLESCRRRLAGSDTYALPGILTHCSPDLISDRAQPFRPFRWEVLPAEYLRLVILSAVVGAVRILCSNVPCRVMSSAS